MRTTFPPLIPLDRSCPNCLGSRQWVFYEQRDVPVSSCVLLDDEREAREFPRGDLRLAFCSGCGFIGNTTFDPTRTAYSEPYEPSQHYSGTFNAFARQLARDLVERHGVQRRRVLEIGCGKGEFLELLCELGGNRGIGVDPAAEPARIGARYRRRIEVLREEYSERHHAIEADVIVCRHTLEHIDQTLSFLAGVRRHVGERLGTLVVFEVPDVRRVLSEGAYWDLYYEHCSYFSEGSMARLMQRAGFEVLETSRVYDEQYVLVLARPTVAGSSTGAAPDDLERLALEVASFEETCRARLDAWRLHLWRSAAASKRSVLWGAGSKCVAFLTAVEDAGRIERVVDINPHKQGKFIPGTGQRVIGPAELRDYRPDDVIVLNPIYAQEVAQELARHGVGASVRTVLGDRVELLAQEAG